jgi:hypothetical protein
VETGIEQPLLSPKEGISVFRFTADDQQLVALQYGLSDSHAYIWNLVKEELAISHHLPIAAITGLALDDRSGEFAANLLPSSNNERHFLKPTIQRFHTATRPSIAAFPRHHELAGFDSPNQERLSSWFRSQCSIRCSVIVRYRWAQAAGCGGLLGGSILRGMDTDGRTRPSRIVITRY